MKLSLDLFSKPIEPFQFPYYRIFWNGSCYAEDTIECKTVNIEVDANPGWNSFIFEVIDTFDVFDPLDNTPLAQTLYNIENVLLDDLSSWPVMKTSGSLTVDYDNNHLTWFSNKTTSAVVHGKVSDHFFGKGFTEICFYINNGKVVDHYYAGRDKINSYHFLNPTHIKSHCFDKNLLGLSNVRLKDQFIVNPRGSSTYEQHWGGLEFSINDLCNFKQNLAQWISEKPWPFKWIHAKYYNKKLPLALAQEFFNEPHCF